MPRKLKTYQTSQGFYDLAIAAPSMKAALEAWGASSNLFHQGFAKEADDDEVIKPRWPSPALSCSGRSARTGPSKNIQNCPAPNHSMPFREKTGHQPRRAKRYLRKRPGSVRKKSERLPSRSSVNRSGNKRSERRRKPRRPGFAHAGRRRYEKQKPHSQQAGRNTRILFRRLKRSGRASISVEDRWETKKARLQAELDKAKAERTWPFPLTRTPLLQSKNPLISSRAARHRTPTAPRRLARLA